MGKKWMLTTPELLIDMVLLSLKNWYKDKEIIYKSKLPDDCEVIGLYGPRKEDFIFMAVFESKEWPDNSMQEIWFKQMADLDSLNKEKWPIKFIREIVEGKIGEPNWDEWPILMGREKKL